MPSPIEFVDGLIHEPSQTSADGLDLTVDSIHRITAPGKADFGGDEYAEPVTDAIEPEKRDPADDYGWWKLDPGTYLLAYNESLEGDATFLLQPHDRLLALGASHPTAHVSDLDPVPLSVPDGGVALKENARVSRLLSLD